MGEPTEQRLRAGCVSGGSYQCGSLSARDLWLTGSVLECRGTTSTMGDEESMTAIKEALIANEPKTAPIDPRFPNTNQVRRTHQTTFEPRLWSPGSPGADHRT